jgi:hypothetical protein
MDDFKSLKFGLTPIESGQPSSRADWIRTSDPYVPNVVRYRAALLPEKKGNHFNDCLYACRWIPIESGRPLYFVGWIPIESGRPLYFVGWTGFEPATTCTPYKCATGLRHHPKISVTVGLQM